MSESPELSVVMPCLNESDTIGICVEKAFRAIRETGIDGEVVVADQQAAWYRTIVLQPKRIHFRSRDHITGRMISGRPLSMKS